MVCRISAAGLLLLFGVCAAAQEKPAVQEGLQSGEAKTAFVGEDFPFEGEITVERLNVRLFPKGDAASSIIAGVLTQGEKIVVVGDQDDFFHILPPKSAAVWVFGRNVKRETSDTGTIITSDTPVRLDSRINGEKLATLPEGAQVKILREHMGWYQIAAPEQVKYYVAKKYVKYLGRANGATPAVDAPKPEALAREKLREAEELAEEQHELITAKKIKEVDFSKVVEAYEEAAAMATSEDVRQEAQAQLRTYRQLQATLDLVKAQLDKGEDTIQKLKDQIEAKNKVEAPKWEFTGHVDTVGRLWHRPGSHKLVQGGKIVCFLRAKEGDLQMEQRLNSLFEKYVAVKGEVLRDVKGWEGFSVVIVESVEEPSK
ncbi:MAG: SH3 domain-containing protein [Planctomycetes bacterium]|nr:SH3 domain-containing protein [Planctomycetota bacterium]